MSLKDVEPGKYRARAVKGAWSKVGDKKTPAVGVLYQFEREPGQVEEIWHVMYLTTTMCGNGFTVQENTFNTLIGTLGYDESVDLYIDDNGNPFFGPAHLADKEVEIVIEMEADRNDPTKSYHRVRWVNELGGSRLAGLSVDEVMGNTSIKAAAAAARARLGVKKPMTSNSGLTPAGTPLADRPRDTKPGVLPF
jgi:hypothetical protein